MRPNFQPYFLNQTEMDKLTEIMKWKRQEIAAEIREVSSNELESSRGDSNPGRVREALQGPKGRAVIAEIKRRSPSAGEIKKLAAAADQSAKYVEAGADCLSILTDKEYFGGALADLRSVSEQFKRQELSVPCLRKDFMVHPIQVLEAAQAGASAILIIVRALADDEMKVLREAADHAGLDSLYEIHSESELDRAIAHNARIIGVNNRDLAVFKTDLSFSERLIPQFPTDVLAVSESGIWNQEDARRARAAGAKAILVGEALMKADSTSDLMGAFHSA